MATTDLILRLQGEAQDLRNSLVKTSAGLKKIQKEIDGLSKKGKAASRKMADGFVKASKRINRAFTGMAGKLAAVMGVAGVSGVFVKATQAAAKFEKSLAKVSTLLSGDVATQIKAFKSQILDLSKSTGESVNVLSDSLFTIISATVKGSETVAGANELLAATSKLAVAGFTDSATATEALTTVLNSYNLTTEDSVSVSDKLTKIAALANTTFGEMAPQLGKVASITSAAGISIEELGFMFATLTAGGRKVNMAMTDMRAIVNGLTKPSAALAKIYEDAGIKSGAAAVKQMGIVKVLELIKEKTGGTFENIQKVIEQQEAWAGAAILLGERLDDAGNVVKEIGESAGATEIAYKKMAKTFSFLSGRFKQEINAVLIQLGEKILPILITKLEGMSTWVSNNADEIVKFFKEMFDAFIGFAKFILDHGKKIAVILASIWAVGSIINFVDWVKKSTVAMAAYGAVVGTVGVGVTGLKKAWVILQAVMSASPIFLVATAFVAVGTAIKSLIDNWDELVSYFDKTPEIMNDQLRTMADTLKNMSAIAREEAYKTFENDPRLQRRLGKEGAKAKTDELRTRTDLLRAAEGIASGAEKAQRGLNAKFNRLMKNMFKGGAFESDKPSGGPGGGDDTSLDDAKEEARIKKIMDARIAAHQRIRALEIASMDEIEAIKATFNDAARTVAQNRYTTQAQKVKEIELLDRDAKTRITEIVKKRDDDVAKAQEERVKEMEKFEEEDRKAAEKNAKKKLEDEKKRRKAILKTIKETEEEDEKKQRERKKKDQEDADNLKDWLNDPMGKLFGSLGKKIVDSVIEATPEIVEVLGEALGGVIQNVFDSAMETVKSVYGWLYEEAYKQIKELIGKAIEAASEGEKLLILTDEERARLERDRGRVLTADEARQHATAMTPQELANQQAQGRIGSFEQVGVDTPADRMQEVLDKMVSYWENLAQNLAPILTWLTNEAVPTLIGAIVKNLPKIIKALNDSWKETIPFIVEQLPVIIDAILTEIPGIAESIIEGVLSGIQTLFEKLPQFMKSIMSFLTESLLSLIDIIGTIIFEAIPGFITELTKQTPSMIKEIVKSLFTELIPGLIKAIVDAIKKAGKSAIVSPYKKTKRWVKRQKWNFHDGGMIGAYKAHQGMFVSPRLAPDEVPIIAQAGEAVLNRQATANAGGEAGINAMNNGGSGGVTINNILQPKHLLSADTAKVLDDMIGSNIAAGVGQVAAAISGEDVDGFDSRR